MSAIPGPTAQLWPCHFKRCLLSPRPSLRSAAPSPPPPESLLWATPQPPQVPQRPPSAPHAARPPISQRTSAPPMAPALPPISVMAAPPCSGAKAQPESPPIPSGSFTEEPPPFQSVATLERKPHGCPGPLSGGSRSQGQLHLLPPDSPCRASSASAAQRPGPGPAHQAGGGSLRIPPPPEDNLHKGRVTLSSSLGLGQGCLGYGLWLTWRSQ